MVIRVFRHYLRREAILKLLFDFGVLFSAFVAVDLVRLGAAANSAPLSGLHGLPLLAGVLSINLASGLYKVYRVQSVSASCLRAALALLFGLMLAYVICNLLPAGSRLAPSMQAAVMFAVAGVVAHRVYAMHTSLYEREPSKVLIYGAGAAAKLVGDSLESSARGVKVVGYLPGTNEDERAVEAGALLAKTGTLLECARSHHADEIVVALRERRAGSMPLRELLDCKVCGIRVCDICTHFEKTTGQIRLEYVNAGWLVFGDGFNRGIYPGAVKRLFDLVCSLILLVTVLPILLLTVCLIRLDSKGPIFYRQERVGQNGETFEVLKFRSMRWDAERDGQPRWAAQKDNRTTRVGRFIRMFRIDEIPQLLNVFLGDMSLVGPRPERPYFVAQLTDSIPYYAVRHSVKPGITGWAQVRYQYGATLQDSVEKLQYDLYYVKNHTLFLDLVILFDTVGVVLSGRGAR